MRVQPVQVQPDPFAQYEWIDLSHTLESDIPSWPTHARYGQVLYESYEMGSISVHNQLVMSEHSGTHMDAPLHFIASGPAHYGTSDIPLERLAGRAATIMATDLPPCSQLAPEHIQAWEEEHGAIMPHDIVLISFGWDKRWGTGNQGLRFLDNWPGLGRDAAEYLVKRGVAGVGTDALSIDAFGDTAFPAHYTLLGNEVYILENVNNLEKLPPFSLFFGFPLKIKEGSGSPLRAVALVEKATAA